MAERELRTCGQIVSLPGSLKFTELPTFKARCYQDGTDLSAVGPNQRPWSRRRACWRIAKYRSIPQPCSLASGLSTRVGQARPALSAQDERLLAR